MSPSLAMTLRFRLFLDSIGLAVMSSEIQFSSIESAFDLLASPEGVAVSMLIFSYGILEGIRTPDRRYRI